MKRQALLVIDPQVDFCDPRGTLYVPGADQDMNRLSSWVAVEGRRFEAIHVTLDQHYRWDIAHPLWWTGVGGHPKPFTVITAAEVRSGIWQTTRSLDAQRSLHYLEALEATQRYPHVIWPEHCLIGESGADVFPAVALALRDWQQQNQQSIQYWRKGEHPYTEHFSAIRAEVPDPLIPETGINQALVDALQSMDDVWIAGEASSHCVANTVRDLLAGWEPSHCSRLKLMTDKMSAVPGFEAQARDFFDEMQQRGVILVAE